MTWDRRSPRAGVRRPGVTRLEALPMMGKGLLPASHVVRAADLTDRPTETWIVPPRPMEASQHLHDAPALLGRWRKRPLGCDDMSIGQILEQKGPFSRLVPEGLEAARHRSDRHARSDLAIEGDLAPTRARSGLAAIDPSSCLQDQPRRSGVAVAVVGQAQSQCMRTRLLDLTLDHDVGDATLPEHPRTTESEREVIDGRGHRPSVGRHGALDPAQTNPLHAPTSS